MASIREVFGGHNRALLTVGSLKGNFGHLEAAAGVVSLIKVLAMLREASIPPQASFTSLNPKIAALEPDNMAIAQKLSPWKAPYLAAFVNSYGAGGSNCALICCQGPPEQASIPKRASTANIEIIYPIILSAASVESLHASAQDLSRYLKKMTHKPNLGDLAFTLSKRCKRHRHAFVIHTANIDSLAQQLRDGKWNAVELGQTPKKVVLTFGGQTKRSVNMDHSLYKSTPNLKRYVDECDEIVRSLGFRSILPAIFQPDPIMDIINLQCGTFAMQYACAKCWIDAGLEVTAMIGHSFGELTAMVASRVLTLHDGLKLIASRASLMTTKWGSEGGTMLAIHSSQQTTQAIVDEINKISTKHTLEIACYNNPSSQVVVGSDLAIRDTEDLLARDSPFSCIRSQRLDVTHGFHSRFTESILKDLDKVSQELTYLEPAIPLETCTPEANLRSGAGRASQHAREPVYFQEAVQRLENRLGPCIWLEAGMNSPITSMIKRATTLPDSHVFQALKISDAGLSSQVMSALTANLWREGVSMQNFDS